MEDPKELEARLERTDLPTTVRLTKRAAFSLLLELRHLRGSRTALISDLVLWFCRQPPDVQLAIVNTPREVEMPNPEEIRARIRLGPITAEELRNALNQADLDLLHRAVEFPAPPPASPSHPEESRPKSLQSPAASAKARRPGRPPKRRGEAE